MSDRGKTGRNEKHLIGPVRGDALNNQDRSQALHEVDSSGEDSDLPSFTATMLEAPILPVPCFLMSNP